MNRQDYLDEGFKQLSDEMVYRSLDHNREDKHRKQIQDYMDTMVQRGEIDISVAQYLHDKENRISQLYLLPKIHKGKYPPPCRLVISANGCPTEKFSEFVDHFLNPYVQTIPSYIKDTTHFLSLIEDLWAVATQRHSGDHWCDTPVHQYPHTWGIAGCQRNAADTQVGPFSTTN